MSRNEESLNEWQLHRAAALLVERHSTALLPTWARVCHHRLDNGGSRQQQQKLIKDKINRHTEAHCSWGNRFAERETVNAYEKETERGKSSVMYDWSNVEQSYCRAAMETVYYSRERTTHCYLLCALTMYSTSCPQWCDATWHIVSQICLSFVPFSNIVPQQQQQPT